MSPALGFRIWSDLYFIEVLDPKSLEPAKEGEVGTLVVTALLHQQRHAVPALELGRPRHLQRGR